MFVPEGGAGAVRASAPAPEFSRATRLSSMPRDVGAALARGRAVARGAGRRRRPIARRDPSAERRRESNSSTCKTM